MERGRFEPAVPRELPRAATEKRARLRRCFTDLAERENEFGGDSTPEIGHFDALNWAAPA